MDYERLTKLITDDGGNTVAVCRFLGTDRCQAIHTPQNCPTCPMMQKFIQQLGVFEEIYTSPEVNDENGI